jgi:hypothetical protein
MLAMQVETDPDTVIVTIDDDTYYHKVGPCTHHDIYLIYF